MMPTLVAPPTTATIERALVACGVSGDGVSVVWDAAADGFVITIHDRARAGARHLPCIDKVAGTDLLLFDDAALQAAHMRYVQDRDRPRRIAEATAALKSLGLFDGMPRRGLYADQAAYVAALEQHAGMSGVVQVSGDREVVLRYPAGDDRATFERMTKVIAVVTYATAVGDLASFGVIGNAAAPSAPR